MKRKQKTSSVVVLLQAAAVLGVGSAPVLAEGIAWAPEPFD